MINVHNFTTRLHTQGFCLLTQNNQQQLQLLLSQLGRVIQEVDVKIDKSSRKQLASAAAMELHTDHPRADLIAWYCLRQTDEGGESLLFDLQQAFDALPEAEQALLYRIQLRVPPVFSGDPLTIPLVREMPNGQKKFYYASWLLVPPDKEDSQGALRHLQQVLSDAAVIRIKMQPGDILVVNNSRLLHGRSAINGSKDRHLLRYWIESK